MKCAFCSKCVSFVSGLFEDASNSRKFHLKVCKTVLVKLSSIANNVCIHTYMYCLMCCYVLQWDPAVLITMATIDTPPCP